MKITVWKAPAFLAPLLRALFDGRGRRERKREGAGQTGRRAERGFREIESFQNKMKE